MRVTASELDRVVRIERKVQAAGFGRAGTETWAEVVTVAAQVRDDLPSRSERTQDGLPQAVRTARVRMRWRDDITSDMRIVYGARVMHIVSGPVEIGRRDGLEMVAQDYSTAGGVQ